MDKLNEEINYYFMQLEESDPEKVKSIIQVIKNQKWIYPFSEVEMKISVLLATGEIDFEKYLSIKQAYDKRNRYLFTYEMSPRTFGETWAQAHVQSLVSELEKPSNEIDPEYLGEYDFWYKEIKIELKASRAVHRESGGKLVEKALSFSSNAPFDMNFQQMKPGCCDVFVWMGVWRDSMKYWVLSSADVISNQYYSQSQHRGNTGEGQLWIRNSNIIDFEKYLVEPNEILEAIVRKAEEQQLKQIETELSTL